MRVLVRRGLWAVVTGLWPVMAAARAEFRVLQHWGALPWACAAVAEGACALALRARQARAEGRRGRERERDAELRIAALEAKVSAYDRALSVMAAYGQLTDGPGPAASGCVTGARDCPSPRRLHAVSPREMRG